MATSLAIRSFPLILTNQGMDCASAELVGEYLLRIGPTNGRIKKWRVVAYAQENGEFAPVWGDNSGGFAFVCVSDGDNLSLVA